MKKQILSFLLLAGLCAGGYVIAGNTVTIENPIKAETLDKLVESISKGVAGLVGAVAIVMFIVSGVLFLAAGGQPERLQTAKKCFMWSVIGAVVALGATAFVEIIKTIIEVK